MPRLIPRLVQALRDAAILKPTEAPSLSLPTQKPKAKSQWRPAPPPPDFSIKGRKKSFLLDPLNPVINKRIYRRHKSLPPVVRVKQYVRARPGDKDKPRRMSVQERQWSSDPYLRMLSSTVRLCEYTDSHLPSDFLIRMCRAKVEGPRSGRPTTIAIPDGLEHPKWRTRRSGFGYYVICRKEAVAEFFRKGTWHGSQVHKCFLDQVTHLLRLRILQEIEWLAEMVRMRPRGAAEKPLLRRLTRAEWNDVRNTGVIPYEGAVAILVVPPVNKNPITKKRPEPDASPLPPDVEETVRPDKVLKPLPPLSVLHPVSHQEPDDGTDLSLHVTLPNPRVPLYNGLALFPSRGMRAALHKQLNSLLFAERRARWRQLQKTSASNVNKSDENSGETDIAEPLSSDYPSDRKASHAYLLCSDAATMLRADAVPLAIALWRLRMWEGAGWKEPWKFILPRIHRR
ncbi:unnamed protein product [Somion occarium]|uniref:Uncharacterized protein n=1 Tax=Somion occarium TaxID=3059160 RepID=A0ABP1D4Q3_9APHY